MCCRRQETRRHQNESKNIARLRRQGLTEIFFEGAEPSFDELPPATFFGRFPEGIYDVEGVTLDGEGRESEVEITHRMPAAACFSVTPARIRYTIRL